MSKTEYSVTADIGGRSWNLMAGEFALQASGSVMARVGDTMVHASVVRSDSSRPGTDYLPLLVDYEERLYAAGKIKGSRWVKREGRPTDEAILSGRVIDRSLRPMFDSRIRKDIQVVVTVMSVDGENDPDVIGLCAASAAVEISNIPWDGPIAGVRVGRIGGKFVLNPSFKSIEGESDLDLIVSGTAEHIIMVEAGAKEVSEADMIAAIEFAQGEIKKIVAMIGELRAKVNPEKLDFELFTPAEDAAAKVKDYQAKLEAAVFQADLKKREADIAALREEILLAVAGDKASAAGRDEEKAMAVNYVFEKMQKTLVQEKILREDRRADGRKLTEIRPIVCEAGLLPRVHGTGLFRRGETQVLTAVTLGGPGDEQILEDIETEEERKKRYIHHYNMPGFASGEVAPIRSPGRREIGHGALAERALLPMIPPKETFPYTLRLVSEVLSSNGSTSMASTCGSTLALMDAGVPIKSPVSGIAMGLVLDTATGEFKILSDIMGMEDGCGHMDFKVAGTKDGITALQLDIKVKGLTVEILRAALGQAHTGRLFILEKILAVLPEPRSEMSKYAPRIVSFRINPEKIRDVIGPGGKIINGIIAETGVDIDIEDDGMVMVTSANAEASKKAVDWIKNLVREVMVGEEFEGKVTRIMDFGAFVEILPGQEGMIHISELENRRVDRVTDIVNIGDAVKVKVIEIDSMGRINLSRRALLPGGDQPRASERPFQRPDRGFGPRPPRHNDRPRFRR